jgi:hypothetical protein
LEHILDDLGCDADDVNDPERVGYAGLAGKRQQFRRGEDKRQHMLESNKVSQGWRPYARPMSCSEDDDLMKKLLGVYFPHEYHWLSCFQNDLFLDDI